MSTRKDDASWTVNFPLVLAGVALIIGLTRFTRLLDWASLYFSFSAFLYSYPEPIGWGALIIKLGLPLLGGLAVGLVAKSNPGRTAGAAGFLAAFVQAWPAIINWENVVPFEVWEYKRVFLVMYLLYFVAYYQLALAGGRLGAGVKTWTPGGKGTAVRAALADLFAWKSTLKPILIGVLTSGITLVLERFLGD